MWGEGAGGGGGINNGDKRRRRSYVTCLVSESMCHNNKGIRVDYLFVVRAGRVGCLPMLQLQMSTT